MVGILWEIFFAQAKDITSFDADESIRFFKRCFHDPSQFRLVFVGNIPLDHFSQLCTTYLASIPRPTTEPSQVFPAKTRATVKHLDIEFPLKPVDRKLRLHLVEDNCSLRVTFYCTIGDDVNGTHESR